MRIRSVGEAGVWEKQECGRIRSVGEAGVWEKQ